MATSLLEGFQLFDVQELAKFSQQRGLRPTRDQVSDLLQVVNLELARYNRMRDLILASLSDNYQLTVSTMVQPFFRALSVVFAEQAISPVIEEIESLTKDIVAKDSEG